MRRELPIAFLLIATGIALWAGKNGELNRLKRWLSPAGETAQVDTESSAKPDTNFSLASDLSVAAPIEVSEENSNLSPSTDFSTTPVMSLQSGFTNPSTESPKFLKTLGKEMRVSSAFKLDLVAELSWIQSEMVIAGKYSQLGRGTGQSRIDLQIGKGSEARALSKICDGRFLYSLKQINGQKKLEFIDLRRIQETRFAAGLSQPDNPTSWIASGGLASFLENAAAAFQFSDPKFFERDGLRYVQLDGTWIQSAIVELLKESVPTHHLDPKIVWNELPRHIPHQVRITFAHEPSLGWLPRQIHFLRFNRLHEDANATDAAAQLSTLAKITFSAPEAIDVDPEDFLQLNTEDVETIDNTPLYIGQVKKFEMQREARATIDTESIIR